MSNLVDRQTNRQTDKQTNISKNITISEEVIIKYRKCFKHLQLNSGVETQTLDTSNIILHYH